MVMSNVNSSAIVQSAEKLETVWIVLYTDDGVFLGKRGEKINNPNQWNFFGGRIDPNEQPEQAVIRELREEACFDGTVLDIQYVTTIGKAVYFVAKVSDDIELKTTTEISEISKFSIKDLPKPLHSKTAAFFKSFGMIV